MARKKSGGNGAGIAIVAVVLLGLLAAIPREVWYFLGALAVFIGAVYAFSKSKRDASTQQSLSRGPDSNNPLPTSSSTGSSTGHPKRSAASAGSSARSAWREPGPLVFPEAAPAPVTREPGALAFPKAAPSAASEPTAVVFPLEPVQEFRIPSAPQGFGTGRWVPRGESVEVAGLRIPGGMLYVGATLPAPNGRPDPCLIDPRKPVAARGDYTERQMDYWPSYSDISTGARRSYLEWLAQGRRDPEADVGFVFLYFYGLERRAILDAGRDPEAKKDWPLIADELRSLLRVYGDKSGSFRGYASGLLNIVQISGQSTQLYKQPVPELPKTYELPLYVKLALGQCAVDGVPVPARLALAWVRLAPDVFLRTPAVRCAEEFDKLFGEKYAQALGGGMVLQRNKTKLKAVYNPASSGFRGLPEVSLTVGDVPDVTALTAPMKKLLPIAEAATNELDAFSRFVGKNPGAKSSLEALLLLPATLWPPNALTALQTLKTRMGPGMLGLTLQELLTALDARAAPTNDRVRALARALEAVNVGMEPDILGGAKVPKPEDQVVLFHVPAAEPTSRSTPAYQAAVLTLQVSAAVAVADGEFGAAELGHLRRHVESWTHLTPNHLCRLLAHLRLLTKVPVSLATLKKKLEVLDLAAREAIAAFMATVAQADGVVTPAEVKALEKVYKALGVDAKKVFSDVHAAGTGAGATTSTAPAAKKPPATTASAAGTGFQLDPARIAALQQDSAKVSSLLANIFREDDEAETKSDFEDSRPPKDEVPVAEGLLGLDEAHTAFARLLLTRQAWTRAELLDAATDLELMLDGALEQLNEAAFDKLDMAFTEGDDPVEVNHDVLEQIAA